MFYKEKVNHIAMLRILKSMKTNDLKKVHPKATCDTLSTLSVARMIAWILISVSLEYVKPNVG